MRPARSSRDERREGWRAILALAHSARPLPLLLSLLAGCLSVVPSHQSHDRTFPAVPPSSATRYAIDPNTRGHYNGYNLPMPSQMGGGPAFGQPAYYQNPSGGYNHRRSRLLSKLKPHIRRVEDVYSPAGSMGGSPAPASGPGAYNPAARSSGVQPPKQGHFSGLGSRIRSRLDDMTKKLVLPITQRVAKGQREPEVQPGNKLPEPKLAGSTQGSKPSSDNLAQKPRGQPIGQLARAPRVDPQSVAGDHADHRGERAREHSANLMPPARRTDPRENPVFRLQARPAPYVAPEHQDRDLDLKLNEPTEVSPAAARIHSRPESAADRGTSATDKAQPRRAQLNLPQFKSSQVIKSPVVTVPQVAHAVEETTLQTSQMGQQNESEGTSVKTPASVEVTVPTIEKGEEEPDVDEKQVKVTTDVLEPESAAVVTPMSATEDPKGDSLVSTEEKPISAEGNETPAPTRGELNFALSKDGAQLDNSDSAMETVGEIGSAESNTSETSADQDQQAGSAQHATTVVPHAAPEHPIEDKVAHPTQEPPRQNQETKREDRQPETRSDGEGVQVTLPTNEGLPESELVTPDPSQTSSPVPSVTTELQSERPPVQREPNQGDSGVNGQLPDETPPESVGQPTELVTEGSTSPERNDHEQSNHESTDADALEVAGLESAEPTQEHELEQGGQAVETSEPTTEVPHGADHLEPAEPAAASPTHVPEIERADETTVSPSTGTPTTSIFGEDLRAESATEAPSIEPGAAITEQERPEDGQDLPPTSRADEQAITIASTTDAPVAPETKSDSHTEKPTVEQTLKEPVQVASVDESTDRVTGSDREDSPSSPDEPESASVVEGTTLLIDRDLEVQGASTELTTPALGLDEKPPVVELGATSDESDSIAQQVAEHVAKQTIAESPNTLAVTETPITTSKPISEQIEKPTGIERDEDAANDSEQQDHEDEPQGQPPAASPPEVAPDQDDATSPLNRAQDDVHNPEDQDQPYAIEAASLERPPETVVEGARPSSSIISPVTTGATFVKSYKVVDEGVKEQAIESVETEQDQGIEPVSIPAVTRESSSSDDLAVAPSPEVAQAGDSGDEPPSQTEPPAGATQIAAAQELDDQTETPDARQQSPGEDSEPPEAAPSYEEAKGEEELDPHPVDQQDEAASKPPVAQPSEPTTPQTAQVEAPTAEPREDPMELAKGSEVGHRSPTTEASVSPDDVEDSLPRAAIKEIDPRPSEPDGDQPVGTHASEDDSRAPNIMSNEEAPEVSSRTGSELGQPNKPASATISVADDEESPYNDKEELSPSDAPEGRYTNGPVAEATQPQGDLVNAQLDKGDEERDEGPSSTGAEPQDASTASDRHVDPVEPVEPIQPIEPIEPMKPAEPTESSEPARPTEPIELKGPVQPARVVESVRSINPIETPVDERLTGESNPAPATHGAHEDSVHSDDQKLPHGGQNLDNHDETHDGSAREKLLDENKDGTTTSGRGHSNLNERIADHQIGHHLSATTPGPSSEYQETSKSEGTKIELDGEKSSEVSATIDADASVSPISAHHENQSSKIEDQPEPLGETQGGVSTGQGAQDIAEVGSEMPLDEVDPLDKVEVSIDSYTEKPTTSKPGSRIEGTPSPMGHQDADHQVDSRDGQDGAGGTIQHPDNVESERTPNEPADPEEVDQDDSDDDEGESAKASSQQEQTVMAGEVNEEADDEIEDDIGVIVSSAGRQEPIGESEATGGHKKIGKKHKKKKFRSKSKSRAKSSNRDFVRQTKRRRRFF